MALVVLCDGVWEADQQGRITCNGVLAQASEEVYQTGLLPPLTYAEANTLLVACSLIFATVFIYRQLSGFINDQKPD